MTPLNDHDEKSSYKFLPASNRVQYLSIHNRSTETPAVANDFPAFQLIVESDTPERKIQLLTLQPISGETGSEQGKGRTLLQQKQDFKGELKYP